MQVCTTSLQVPRCLQNEHTLDSAQVHLLCFVHVQRETSQLVCLRFAHLGRGYSEMVAPPPDQSLARMHAHTLPRLTMGEKATAEPVRARTAVARPIMVV